MARSKFSRLFGWPLILAAFTVVGLAAALIGGEGWRPLSWFALGVPLAVIVWKLVLSARASG